MNEKKKKNFWENNEWELDLLGSAVIDKVGKENADCDIELK